MSKQYGLIIPNSNKKATGPVTITRPSIFDEDSDSDTPKLSKPTGLGKARRQNKIDQDKALEQDPTVYQYDEVYDEIAQKRLETKLSKKDIDKKPKYIERLLTAAERRKRENERRVEKQVQKEREAEGEQFKDKESFVTSSYKKKLEELKALEEQEKREEYLEAIGDVTKQGNLDGFYRHLYDQKVNYEDKIKDEENESHSEIKEEPESENEGSEKTRNTKRKKSAENISDRSDADNEVNKIKKNCSAKRRKYRSRKHSEKSNSESESEHVEVKKEHLPSNLDADSDFSIDSSSDSETEDQGNKETDTKGKDNKIEHEGEKLQLPEKGNVLSDNVAMAKKVDGKDNESQEFVKEEKKVKEKCIEEEKPKKPKIDIWKKRTVGTVFDEAVKRYFERKAARDAERNV